MSKIFPSKDIAENKLLILYILDKINMPVGSIELTNYILEERLMGFIDFQQYVHELADDNYIKTYSAGGITQYSVTDGGAALIKDMVDLLPGTEKNRVNRTVGKQKRRTINARSVTADYTPDNEKCGVVHLKMIEGEHVLLELNIATASKEEALLICKNWREKTSEVFTGIYELLLCQNETHKTGKARSRAYEKTPQKKGRQRIKRRSGSARQGRQRIKRRGDNMRHKAEETASLAAGRKRSP